MSDNDTIISTQVSHVNNKWSRVAQLTKKNNKDSSSSYGASLAINSNATTAIVSDYIENDGKGAVYVYKSSGRSWKKTARIFTGVDYGYFGKSVSLNCSGTTALIGAYVENNNKGAAYIYKLSKGVWKENARLISDNSKDFGWSVSLNATGTVALIGSPGENAAYIYAQSDGIWTQKAKLTSKKNNGFGFSVAINADGTVAVIGAYNEKNGKGAAYIYKMSNKTWKQTHKLSGQASFGYFGHCVCINSDGNVAMIGAESENNNTGAAYIYNLTNGKLVSKLTSGVQNSFFGSSLSLSDNGDIAFIGAWGESVNTGAIYVYTEDSGVWSQTDKIISKVRSSFFGCSVSANSTGDTVVVGADIQNKDDVLVYVYKLKTE
jgi:hypothetical protein